MLKISNLSKTHVNKDGSTIKVFDNLNLEISDNSFISIFGPNGCGKTTLLDLISGLTEPDSGTITLLNNEVKNKKIGYVFQDYRNSLFPWRNVEENISFPLEVGVNKLSDPKKIKESVLALCSKFDYSFNLKSYPYNLSGGQQQFIALLRALVIKPDLYILDEPFASLDYQTTLFMLQKTTEIWQKENITTLFVSHELDEAIFLGQKIILLGKNPTGIVEVFDNPLPYPRTIELLRTPQFALIKNKILDKYMAIIN